MAELFFEACLQRLFPFYLQISISTTGIGAFWPPSVWVGPPVGLTSIPAVICFGLGITEAISREILARGYSNHQHIYIYVYNPLSHDQP